MVTLAVMYARNKAIFASIRPRSVERGNQRDFLEGILELEASIRPRSVERGNS